MQTESSFRITAAGAGLQGRVDLLETFKHELYATMALSGVARVADIGPDLIDS